MQGVFVTGVDTGIGKTVISAGILKLLYGAKTVRYWKPIQTGTIIGDDTDEVKAITELPDSAFFAPEYRFAEPVSPNVAAKKWKHEISVDHLHKKFLEYSAQTNFMIMEGSGGLLVPLNDHDLQIDFFSVVNVPLILVAEDRVGAINQCLLTIRAAREKGLEVFGVILSKARGIFGNAESISHFGKVEVLAQVPPIDDPRRVVAHVACDARLRQVFNVPPLP